MLNTDKLMYALYNGYINSLSDYFNKGSRLHPGDFYYELITGDLKGIVETADSTNMNLLHEWLKWLYNEAPNTSWGSVENYNNWIKLFENYNKNKKYIKTFNVPSHWIEVYSEQKRSGDFLGDPATTYRIILGWRHDGEFTSIDKCPEEYIKFEELVK